MPLPFLPHAFPLLQHVMPPTAESPSWPSPTWVFPMGCCPSGSSVWPFHELQSFRSRQLQCGSPMGHSSSRKSAPVWSPLHGLQLLKGVCSCMGFTQAVTSLRAHLTALVWDLPQASVWISTPPWSSMGLQGDNLCHYGGIFALSLGACLPPPSLLTCYLHNCFFHTFSFLSHICCDVGFFLMLS